VSHESLGLVNIIDTFTATTNMLRKQGANSETAGTNTNDDWVLRLSATDRAQLTHLGSYRLSVFGVALDSKVEHGLLVFVVEQAVNNHGRGRILGVDSAARYVANNEDYTCTKLSN
jgi:hypothetical protein